MSDDVDKNRRRKLWIIEIVLAIPLFIGLAIGLVACMVIASMGITLKGVLLVVGLFTIAALSGYGIWRCDKEAGKISMEEIERTGEASKPWYLAPLAGLIGGLSAYYKLKDFDEKLARRLLFLGILVTIVLMGVQAYRYYITLSASTPKYLTYRDGIKTKVFLLGSDLRYGVYDHDIHRLRGCKRPVKKGEPCVIINVTIRNDYTEEWPLDYQIALTADLYNTEGEKVGTVMTYGQLFCGFVEAWKVECGETRTFDIYVDYDKKDIDRYELYIYNSQKEPSP